MYWFRNTNHFVIEATYMAIIKYKYSGALNK